MCASGNPTDPKILSQICRPKTFFLTFFPQIFILYTNLKFIQFCVVPKIWANLKTHYQTVAVLSRISTCVICYLCRTSTDFPYAIQRTVTSMEECYSHLPAYHRFQPPEPRNREVVDFGKIRGIYLKFGNNSISFRELR